MNEKASNKKDIPEKLLPARECALKILGKLVSAGLPDIDFDTSELGSSARTDGGRSLPEYYLVYFLLVDLLGFHNLGQWEKVAWVIPVKYHGRLYTIEHRKMGLGIFASIINEESESDARTISKLIHKAVKTAKPYFIWRAEQTVSGNALNVINHSLWLYKRYEYFRDRFTIQLDEAKQRKNERNITEYIHENGSKSTNTHIPYISLIEEAEWTGQATIEAFFSWTEQVFIHLAIIQAQLKMGDEVKDFANKNWSDKFKVVLDVSESETKKHFQTLINLRFQIRNFMAHGAFGKSGEAFEFHSSIGAVPIRITGNNTHKYAFSGNPVFNEKGAIADIENFISYLWSGSRAPAKLYIMSGLPSILSLVSNNSYANAMKSIEDMQEFVDATMFYFDNAGNMDW